MPSNGTYACIPCRYSVKQTYTCPYCSQTMIYMGKAFKPPRRSEIRQWAKVATLVDHDVRFGYCKCHRRRGFIKSASDAKNMCNTRRSDKKSYVSVDDVRSKQISDRKKWKAKIYG